MREEEEEEGGGVRETASGGEQRGEPCTEKLHCRGRDTVLHCRETDSDRDGTIACKPQPEAKSKRERERAIAIKSRAALEGPLVDLEVLSHRRSLSLMPARTRSRRHNSRFVQNSTILVAHKKPEQLGLVLVGSAIWLSRTRPDDKFENSMRPRPWNTNRDLQLQASWTRDARPQADAASECECFFVSIRRYSG